jgi:hypothetical protein
MGHYDRNAKSPAPPHARPGAHLGAGGSGLVERQERPTLPAPSELSTSGTRPRAHRRASSDELQRIRLDLIDRYSAGDYAAALALAEDLQARNADDLSASSFAKDCRKQLEDGYVKRLGSLERVPVLAISMPELQKRSLDHKAGFLLSRVDGQSSVEVLLDLVAMPRAEALRILVDLVGGGILQIR